MTLRDLFERMWAGYCALTPQATRVHALLAARGELVHNDHVALRTFDRAPVGLEALARVFVAAGYKPGGEYHFPEKKLRARHYEPPHVDLPKVFISELCVAEFSAAAQARIDALLAAVPADLPYRDDFAISGRPWSIRFAEYQSLLRESEYAAWVSAFGFRANHFTVDVNRLQTFASLEEVTAYLQSEGFRFNHRGGLIKGSPALRLEQSSTMADAASVSFRDGERQVPSCYYEFARRYPLPSGELFAGFIEGSADKLFESTDAAAR